MMYVSVEDRVGDEGDEGDSLLCSVKLLREKFFVNLEVLWLFAKVFYCNFVVLCIRRTLLKTS